jgi:hypothetical protein
MTTNKTILNVLVGSIAASVYAGTPVETPSDKISVVTEAGISYDSAFVFRGLKLDSNPVFRPYANSAALLGKGIGGFDAVYAVASTTQTLNTSQPNATWSRSDVGLGFALQKGDLTIAPTYQIVNSPNGAFKSAQGINVEVSYDDSKLLGALALKPHASVYFGLDGNLGGGTQSGTYYEVGVAPSTTLAGIKVSAPVTAGFGSGNYYTGGTKLGYVSYGVQASKKVTDRVSVNAGINYFNTSGNVNQNSNFWQSTLGISWGF